MTRPLLLALFVVAGTASAADALDWYHPGVDQPPAGGTHYTFGPALIYGSSSPDAHALPNRFNAWGADAAPPLVLPAAPAPRTTGFRGWFSGFRTPAPAPQPAVPHRSHWHSNRFGY